MLPPIDINICLLVAGALFVIGILGVVLNRRNLIAIFMSIELILLSINLNFVFFSVFLKDMEGQVISLFILTIAAAEIAIGLAILVSYYKQRQTIQSNEMQAIPSETEYLLLN